MFSFNILGTRLTGATHQIFDSNADMHINMDANKKLKKFTLTIWKSSGRSCLFLSKFPILCTKLVGTAVYVVSKKRGKL